MKTPIKETTPIPENTIFAHIRRLASQLERIYLAFSELATYLIAASTESRAPSSVRREQSAAISAAREFLSALDLRFRLIVRI